MKTLNKFIYSIIFGVIASLGACTDEIGYETDDIFDSEINTLTVTISNGSLSTRSDYLSDIQKREDAIKRVQLFLFDNSEEHKFIRRIDYDDLDTISKSKHIIKFTPSEIESYFGTLSQSKELLVYAVVNYLPVDQGGSQTTWLPGGKEDPNHYTQVDPTIEMLEGWRLGRAFNNYRETNDRNDILPSQFVMFGNAKVSLNWTTRRAEVTIPVRRIAAKIRVGVNIANEIEVKEEEDAQDGVIWTPVVDEIKVSINNGFNIGRLDGKYKDENGNDIERYYTDQDGKPEIVTEVKKTSKIDENVDYFSSTEQTSRKLMEISNKEIVSKYEIDYWNERPFYTYPHGWSATSAADQHRTMIILMVPWREETNDEVDYVNTYYRIPINTKDNELVANTYYRLKLNIESMGSIDPGEPVEITDAHYEILPWQEENMNVNVQVTRFLVCPQTEFVLNNQEIVEIPFVTSHSTIVDENSIKITFSRFNDDWNGRNYDGELHEFTIGKSENDLTMKKSNDKEFLYSAKIEGNTLIFEHPLTQWDGYVGKENTNNDQKFNYQNKNNLITDKPDYYRKVDGNAYYPYYITITIRHEDQTDPDTRYQQTINIIQYPPMYIEAERNPGNNTGTNRKTNFTNGFVSVNNRAGSSGNNNVQFGTLGNLNGDNTNPNMYVINVTLLNQTDNYLIGDPRTLDYNINLSNGSFTNPNSNNPHNAWTTDPSAVTTSMYPERKPDNRKNTLCFYYPTDEATGAGSSKENMIAPIFRIASSWGTTQTMSRENARKRCATYQEQGRPAGRWRLPTKGEMEYIVVLSSLGKIPALFSPSTIGSYWTAQGAYNFRTGDNKLSASNVSSAFVRCLYDEWYWVKEDGSEDTCDPGTFTWGDKPMDNPQNPGN